MRSKNGSTPVPAENATYKPFLKYYNPNPNGPFTLKLPEASCVNKFERPYLPFYM